MRHRVAGKHLGRNVGQRNALRRTLTTQFFMHEKITTTRAKAEAIRGEAEHLITKAKHSLGADAASGIHARRILAARLDGKAVVTKVFDELAPRYADRNGGYTRIYKLGPRKGDAAEMVVLELVDRPAEDDAPATGVAGVARRAGGLFSRLRGNRGQNAESKPEAKGDEASS